MCLPVLHFGIYENFVPFASKHITEKQRGND